MTIATSPPTSSIATLVVVATVVVAVVVISENYRPTTQPPPPPPPPPPPITPPLPLLPTTPTGLDVQLCTLCLQWFRTHCGGHYLPLWPSLRGMTLEHVAVFSREDVLALSDARHYVLMREFVDSVLPKLQRNGGDDDDDSVFIATGEDP